MEFAELIKTPKVDGVVLHTSLSRPVDVALCLTGHHLILSARREGVEELWVIFIFIILNLHTCM
jgi:myotubularin-related protein 9